MSKLEAEKADMPKLNSIDKNNASFKLRGGYDY